MWYQLEVLCQQTEAEVVGDFLEAQGALSVSFVDKNDDPILEPPIGTTPMWPEVLVQGLFTEEIKALLAKELLYTLYPHLTSAMHLIEQQDWQSLCQKQFKPQFFGNRLWVCPSWETPPYPKAVNLILDPGLAFGTGTHPTTHLCLQWLDQSTLNDKTLIDYGCGSGILALAALKLGAKKVWGVDIDPQALEATHNNAEKNDILQDLTIGEPEKLQTPVDIIIANILFTPLVELEKRFKQLLLPEGLLVVSGILKEQTTTLIKAYTHFKHQYTLERGDWALVVFK